MDSQKPQSPPPHLSQTPLHLQPVVVPVGPNPFVNSTFPTTMMTPFTARFPPFNTNTNPSPHSESFIKDASVSVTAPSTTVEPCMETVVEGSSSAFVSSSGANTRKRGRPRKHVSPQANDDHHSGSGEAQTDPAPAPAALANPAPDSSTATKTRGRGRPRGSCNKKRNVQVHGQDGSCVNVSSVINVNPGENIMAKLPSTFRGGRGSQLCVLSASGLISTVSLHQSGSIVTYEGDFGLISLSCTFKLFESKKGFKRMIDWWVGLVGPDPQRLIGGLVVDKLIAASPVTVILGSVTLEDANASLNNWESEASAPSSQFSASGIPASANVQEPAASDQSTGENVTMRTFF